MSICDSGLSSVFPSDVAVKGEHLTSGIIVDSSVEIAWIDGVNLFEEGDPDVEMTRSINVFFLLSERILDLRWFEADMSEIVLRQYWTSWISEEG